MHLKRCLRMGVFPNYTVTLQYICYIVIFLSVTNEVVLSKKTENEEKCIWFDECGSDPSPGRGSKTLNCVYNGEPGKAHKYIPRGLILNIL